MRVCHRSAMLPFEVLVVVLLLTVFSDESLLTLDVTVVTSSSSENRIGPSDIQSARHRH